jgi:branched-chain amino acid transport system ATP-binding protein
LPILLVEQSLDVCRAVAERHVIIDEGRVVWSGDTEALDSADRIVREHLTLENV